MLEIITEAIVLDKEDFGEQDSRVFLYAKDWGKLNVFATSLRKIISKLAGHLEPLNYSMVRLVSRGNYLDKKNLHLADALLIDSSQDLKSNPEALLKAIKIFELVSKSAPEGLADQELWDFLQAVRKNEMTVDLNSALKVLGLDPVFANCQLCGKNQPEYFFPKDQFFICRFCSLNSKEDQKQFIKYV